MSCVLRVGGIDFDVDTFLRNSRLAALAVFHHGDPQLLVAAPRARIHSESGMNVSVSKREFLDLPGQIEDAIAFLREQQQELVRLRRFPGVERLELDFPVEDRDVAVQSDSFPPELLRLIGELEITLVISRYPSPQNEVSS